MYFNKSGKGEYFDSYGLPPGILGLKAYINHFSMDLIYSHKTMQSLLLNVCDHYCVYSILLSRYTYHVECCVTHRWVTVHYFSCTICYLSASRQESVVWSVAPQLQQNSSHTFINNNFNPTLRKIATKLVCNQVFQSLK